MNGFRAAINTIVNLPQNVIGVVTGALCAVMVEAFGWVETLSKSLRLTGAELMPEVIRRVIRKHLRKNAQAP